MNGSNPFEKSPNEVAVEIVEKEERLKALRVEQDRLLKAVKEYPSSGFDEDLDKVSNEIAELEKEINDYHTAKKDQLGLDLEPGK